MLVFRYLIAEVFKSQLSVFLILMTIFTSQKSMPDIERMLSDSSGEIIDISGSARDAETPEWRQDMPDVIPVMPLRGVVLFPGTVAPLTVERPASQRLLEELLPTGRLLGLCTQYDDGVDVPKKEDVYRIGVLGNVLRMMRQDSDHLLVPLSCLAPPASPPSSSSCR